MSDKSLFNRGMQVNKYGFMVVCDYNIRIS